MARRVNTRVNGHPVLEKVTASEPFDRHSIASFIAVIFPYAMASTTQLRHDIPSFKECKNTVQFVCCIRPRIRQKLSSVSLFMESVQVFSIYAQKPK